MYSQPADEQDQRAAPAVPGFSNIAVKSLDANGNAPSAGFTVSGLVSPGDSDVEAQLVLAGGGSMVGDTSPQTAASGKWQFSFANVPVGDHTFVVEVVGGDPNAS